MTNEITAISITREELYEKVWQTPMAILAKEFGLSDKGLAKICIKFNIPCPGRGYWRKVETGAVLEKTRLPTDSKVTSITIRGDRLKKVEPVQKFKDIPVPNELQNPHSLIVEAKKLLSSKKRDINAPTLDIRVTRDSQNRAFILIDTIIKELEKQGAKIVVKKYRETVASINDEEVQFHIEERNERIEEKQIIFLKSKRYVSPEELSRPTGKQALIIDSYGDFLRQNFRDGRKQRVEQLLPEFIHTMGKVAEFSKARKEEWRIQELKDAEAQKRREIEQAHITFLKDDIERFEYAVRLKRYLRLLRRTPNIKDDWIDWVENFLERLQKREVASPESKTCRYETRHSYGGW